MDEDHIPFILVIDDEPALRLGLVVAIKRHGYRAEAAEDGSSGLQKARELLPDLIISDVMMPLRTGLN